jgi:hypothetical protein
MKVIILGVLRGQPLNVDVLDEDYEVWCMNHSWEPERWTRWFNLHGSAWIYFSQGDFALDWMRHTARHRNKAVYVWKHEQKHFPGARIFPIDALIDLYGNYYTHSVPYLTAFARMRGATEIVLDQMVFGAGERFAIPCVEYHFGRAEEAGIKITIADPQSELFNRRGGLYGLERWGNESLKDGGRL